MKKVRNVFINNLRYLCLVGVIALGLMTIVGTGGSPTHHGTHAWVGIDYPEDDYSTGSDVVIARGRAGMSDGSYPDGVSWYSNYSSGGATSSVSCWLGCIAAWRATIPLALGENTITVTMRDASDEVTITRYTVVTVSGKITMDETSGTLPADIPVILTGIDTNRITRTDEGGNYSFSYITAGTYTITPSQPSPPQSSACLDNFTPSSREISVPTDDNSDIVGQNFIATQGIPCYRIGGRVTASTNPSHGLSDREITLSDQDGNLMVRYTDAFGNYRFFHLEPGTYTLTPSYCTFELGCFTFIPDFIEVTITSNNIHSMDFLQEF